MQNYQKCQEDIFRQNYKNNPKLLLKLAWCIYKDNELNKEYSLLKSLEILKTIDIKQLNIEQKKYLLTLYAKIYKKRFETVNKIEYLIKAIKYYKKSWKKFQEINNILSLINYAILTYKLGIIINDKRYINKANEIIKNAIDFLQYSKKYDYLALTHFFIKDFDKTKKFLSKTKLNDKIIKLFWEITHLKRYDNNIVKDILQSDFEYSNTKIGLALSGGGFRASLFHLGTLAALAEADILKDIETISCVSGGSIVGVLYYLKLKYLLESKMDKEIVQNDYLDLVENLINEFVDIITTKNIRSEVFFKFDNFNEFLNFYNPFSSYTRTHHIAKLYDKYFYSKERVKYLKDLLIIPKGEKEFHPRYDNFKRNHKIPTIIINATNLNNGHNFQFHATKMGESGYKNRFDRNFRLKWLRNDCSIFNNFEISKAVAASSAVPGVFPALKFNLKNIEINLADGGLFENIGLNALFVENCNKLFISDAGYEMKNIKKLSSLYKIQIIGATKYIKRSIDILMDTNKYFAYQNIKTDAIYNILANEIEFFEIDCFNTSFKKPAPYEYLARVRTDLNKFSKYESYMLIHLGYIRMKSQLNTTKDYNFKFKSTIKNK